MIGSAVRWKIVAGSVAVIEMAICLDQIVGPRRDDSGQELLQGWALLSVLCVPAAFAVFAIAARPLLLLVGALMSVATSPLLGTLMPILWVFAAVYAYAFAKQPLRSTVAPPWAVAAVPVLFVLAGGALIIGSTEMVCVTTVHPRGSGTACGQTTTASGSIAALVAVAVAVAGGLLLSSPRRPDLPVTSTSAETKVGSFSED